MPSIKPYHVIITAVLALALGGCGDKNDKAVFSQDSGHASDWILTHKNSARANIESCMECHSDDYTDKNIVSISKVSCMKNPTAVGGFTCHASSPVENPTGCVSCHGGLPSGPFGITAPNRKSAHTKHTALVGCDTCHPNAGSGTVGHAKADANGGLSGATVVLPAIFKAFNT